GNEFAAKAICHRDEEQGLCHRYGRARSSYCQESRNGPSQIRFTCARRRLHESLCLWKASREWRWQERCLHAELTGLVGCRSRIQIRKEGLRLCDCCREARGGINGEQEREHYGHVGMGLLRQGQ